MPRLSQTEIRNNAISFVHEWKDETRERAEAQTFWNEFLNIFGVKRRQVAVFEKAVQKNNLNTGAIDLFWRGVLLVEHKSRGQNLDKASSQAFEYLENLNPDELPELALISDFDRFRLYNLETNEEVSFSLAQLPDLIHLFGAISGYQKREYKEQDPVNLKVALKLGELHDALLESGYSGHKLEVFLVRLVYCLFADDTGIFLPRSSFLFFLEERTAENGSDLGANLAQMFQVLDTPEAERQRTLDDELRAFPHVNGSLFATRYDLPFFDKRMRQLLIEACGFDWSKVSPAIFGSLFQSVMDREKRRNLGAHYTSEKNILKVIHGLFLDDLLDEFASVRNNLPKLRQFHEKIARLRFFDPACGSGNFLVITYREMRRLELEVVKQERKLTGDVRGRLLVEELSKIDVNSFYGIEYEEFPAEIARVALWLTDHLSNMELSAEFGVPYTRLPLQNTPNIVHGNALQLNWSRIFDFEVFDNIFVLGNPPFIGKDKRSAEQTADMEACCSSVANFKSLDYVCAWYVKAAELITNTSIKAAFVSTNSITQGEQVGILWSYLFSKGVNIHFAHRTFRWSNEAAGNAAVYCVIIGFGLGDVKDKRLFDYENPKAEAREILARNINPYLVDGPAIIISSRNTPLSPVPNIVFGSKPVDGGFLLLEPEERDAILRLEPDSDRFILQMMGAHEFINGKERYCIWLKDTNPSDWRHLSQINLRVQEVREFRLKSKKAPTVRLAELPYLFAEIRQPDEDYVLVPLHSSENRKYIPIGFLPSSIIFNNSCAGVPNASLYHFGILTSTMHNAWMRQICGRLKSDYRYSNNLVYNNFPWPIEPTDRQMQLVENTAQQILDARALFPDATLADLYGPLAMPKDLLDAHRANDKAVDACYGRRSFKTELERLEFLFELYRSLTAPLGLTETPKRKRGSKTRNST